MNRAWLIRAVERRGEELEEVGLADIFGRVRGGVGERHDHDHGPGGLVALARVGAARPGQDPASQVERLVVHHPAVDAEELVREGFPAGPRPHCLVDRGPVGRDRLPVLAVMAAVLLVRAGHRPLAGVVLRRRPLQEPGRKPDGERPGRQRRVLKTPQVSGFVKS